MLLEILEGTVNDILASQVTRLTVGSEVMWFRTSRARPFPLAKGEKVTVIAARVGSEGMLIAVRFWRHRDDYEFRPQLHSSVPLQIAASTLLLARRRLGRGTHLLARRAASLIACLGFMYLREQRTFIREHRRTLPPTTLYSTGVPRKTTVAQAAKSSGEVPFGLRGSAPSPETPWWHSELLEHTQDAIIIWEMEGDGILYWNQSAEHLYGYSRDEAHGKVTHDLLRTVTRKSVKEVESILARYGVWVGELRHTAKNGRIVEVEGRLSLMSQRNGRWLVLEVNRDITDRKRADAAGAARENSLSNLNKSR